MADGKAQWALGMMSGTSMDGVDAALILTDGERVLAQGPALTLPYDDEVRGRIAGVLGRGADPAALEAATRDITRRHGDAVQALLAEPGAERPAVIGFHGQTVDHRPADRFTSQIGDAGMLAAETGIDVVFDFRQADVKAGGEGAPFAPVYHRALAAGLPGGDPRNGGDPIAVLNLGGVGNVTWIGPAGAGVEDGLLAFDTGPGNALIDDWVAAHGAGTHDAGGRLAAAGASDEDVLARLMDHPYFAKRPPKSLDRNDFRAAGLDGMRLEDGAATLARFTARSVAAARQHFPKPAASWLVTGGGRHNAVLMAMLANELGVTPETVRPVEAVGWRGDSLEAEAFALLAVRSLRGLPLSFPGTTGVPHPMPGGRLVSAPREAA